MIHNRSVLTVMFTLALGVTAACGNTSDESSAEPNLTQEDSSNENTTVSTTENTSDNEFTISKKDGYLKKLNDTKKELEEVEAEDSSTFTLKKVENDRWEVWDALLNEIYGVLKEQLPPEEMNQLKEEQRKWIQYRDDSALEASLLFKGGTQEHLEYVAVLANLTEERCYGLVETYMK
ncbi:DUF1311 domain-containing protein [Sporosarcina sp. ACRSL]|uniref:lysozyme inhibitor LprI family protein n=1 Tax=Sporosarcina sp. ACRSL TaxID=2918215 RepID=UPI001EF58175|nr:lysozyme inhibitor LprI family protein [Sporosarcina sp. ACRSL]MCG7344896.1 DUF1311 domain-containing protein [Sporosarcina sp. ACRSL]